MRQAETDGTVEGGLDAPLWCASVGEVEHGPSRRHGTKSVDLDLIQRREEPGGVDRPRKCSWPASAEDGEFNGVRIGAVESVQRCCGLVADPAARPEAQQADHQALPMSVGGTDDPVDARCHPLEVTGGHLPRTLRIG